MPPEKSICSAIRQLATTTTTTTMPSSKHYSQTIKQRVLTCLTKLSDRDTHSLATTELHSIAQTLDTQTLPLFLHCIHSTDNSDTTPLRKQCVRIIATLSEIHGNALSPHIPKILTNLVRRFRDPDSSVRTACTESVSSLTARVTRQPFSVFLKPLTEALFTEQEQNAQAAAATCLASAVEASPDPEPARLAKLMPRFQKLLKCDGFKAKAALLHLIGSVVQAGGASGGGIGAVRSLVACLVEALGSADWAARKGAAEALGKLAMAERDSLSEFKARCLEVLQKRRFDKVKLVRDVMNETLEAWKQVPDVSDEFSPPPRSQCSSKENASDGRYPSVSQNSCGPGSVMTKFRRSTIPVSRSTPPNRSTTSNAKTSALSNNKRISPGVLRKSNHKNWDVQIAVSGDPFKADQGDLQKRNESVLERSKKDHKSRFFKSETRRALFDKKPDDSKVHKFGRLKGGSRVVPFSEEIKDAAPVHNVTKDLHKNDNQSEELSQIHNQLQQIEKQQSSLLDILQKFIGSSENGMRLLESRVHGLELALDEISYDLAVTSGRMTKSDAPRNTCCLLPGAELLSSKFWRKTQSRYSSSQNSRSEGTQSIARNRCRDDRNSETKLTNHRFRVLGERGGFITNPLAEINTNARDISGFARAEPL